MKKTARTEKVLRIILVLITLFAFLTGDAQNVKQTPDGNFVALQRDTASETGTQTGKTYRDNAGKVWQVYLSIASKHWLLSENKKEKAFKEWLYNTVEADVNSIEAGAFEESGTKIETVLIIIDKPAK